MMRYKFGILITFYMVFLLACQQEKPEQTTSFYYWKTSYQITNNEKKLLKELAVKKIYFRAFDVMDSEPVGVLQWADTLLSDIEYVPVVFIDKEVFRTIDSNENYQLAKNLYRLISGVCDHKNFEPQEIQIDCDWTKETKRNYFYFLSSLKKIAAKKLSVTIRLHQIKFAQSTGVPPCDYGVLMCYNMGNIKSASAHNSIYEKKVLISYLKNANYYLPLKPALPIFDWMLWYRGEQFMGILPNRISTEMLKDFSNKQSNVFSVYQDKTLADLQFKSGDIIRLESVSQNDLTELKKYLRNTRLNLSEEFIYFSLDNANLIQYEKNIFTY